MSYRPSSSFGIFAHAFMPSALSIYDFGVEGFEFCTGIVDFELPVHAALFGIAVCLPGRGFRLQCGDVTKAAILQTLPCQATQFVFGDVEPASVFGCVTERDSPHQFASFLWSKRFVECSHRVSVQGVADHDDFFGGGITSP